MISRPDKQARKEGLKPSPLFEVTVVRRKEGV